MKLPDAVLIRHILYECEKILKLTTSISYEEFENNTTYQDAIIRPLEVIGEAAGNLSGEFLQNHQDIPIANMNGMRNLLAHQYYRVDLETLGYCNKRYTTCIFPSEDNFRKFGEKNDPASPGVITLFK